MTLSPADPEVEIARRGFALARCTTWLTTSEVAAVLGVTQPRVSQLARRGFLPYERTPSGRQVFRPAQIEVIARARRERFHAGRDG